MQPKPKKSANAVKSPKKEIVSDSHKKGSQNAVFVHNKYDGLHDEGEGEMEQDTVAETPPFRSNLPLRVPLQHLLKEPGKNGS